MPREEGSVRRGRGSQVALAIQQQIQSGQLRIGDRLPNERQLCQELNVSRATLREAVRMLEAEGIVEVRRGVTGGTFVVKPEAEGVGYRLAALLRFGQVTPQDFSEFRLDFEPETARLAAVNGTPEDVDQLAQVVESIREATVPGVRWGLFSDLDIQFHEQIAVASHNPIRVAVMLAVHEAFHQTSESIGSFDSETWRLEQHRQVSEIAAAIMGRKAALAKRLMQFHIKTNLDVTVVRLTSHAPILE